MFTDKQIAPPIRRLASPAGKLYQEMAIIAVDSELGVFAPRRGARLPNQCPLSKPGVICLSKRPWRMQEVAVQGLLADDEVANAILPPECQSHQFMIFAPV